jgi:hypothetical protein
VRTNFDTYKKKKREKKKNVHNSSCPEHIYFVNILLIYSVVAVNSDVGDGSVGPHCLPHQLTGNHYRDFISHDLPKLLETVPLAEHECGTCMMALRHIRTVPCEIFSITYIMTHGQVEEDTLHGLHDPRQI